MKISSAAKKMFRKPRGRRSDRRHARNVPKLANHDQYRQTPLSPRVTLED